MRPFRPESVVAWVTAALWLAAGPAAADPGPPVPPAVRAADGGEPAAARVPPGALRDTAADRLRVSLLTFGSGARVWEKFGHNALMVRDTVSGAAEVFNWGIFDFAQEDFFRRLLVGEMRYRIARFTRAQTLSQYRSDRRSVRAQRLRLTPSQERELLRKARINLRPENRFYAYDPFRDNCSTRARDLLDEVLDGAIRRRTEGVETAETFRSHTRRLLGRTLWPYLGIMVGLGSGTDRRIDAWEEMFLPFRMEARLREIRVPDGSGGTAPLVVAEDTLYRSPRPPAPARVPGRLPWLLGAGLLLGALLAVLGRGARAPGGPGSRGAGWGFGGLATLWSLLAGTAGSILVLSWLFTDHWYMHANENLLQVTPLSLLLAVAIPVGLGTGRGRSGVTVLAWSVAGLSMAGACLQVLPGFDQVNGSVVALALPVHAGLALGWTAASGAREGAGEGPTGPWSRGSASYSSPQTEA